MGSAAGDAYDAFAPVYDEFNAQNDYELWLGGVLLPELEKHGLRVGRVLDIGCGTGRAFEPLIRRGWEVHGCDVSEGMLREAARKYPDVPLRVADATNLPAYDCDFDLVLLLNDVINYFTEDGNLELFFEGVKRNLAPRGLLCFDANCLSLFEANWIADKNSAMVERGWQWIGLSDEAVAGGIYEVELSGDGIERHLHRQRHWTQEQVQSAMAAPGLQSLAVLGMTEDERGVVLEDPPDEQRHYKTIYIAGHDG